MGKFMRYIITRLTFACLLIFLIVSAVPAQDTATERWEYAFDENGDVRAYTLSGENVVIGHVEDPLNFRNALRVDDERIILFEDIGDNLITIWRFTPSQIDAFQSASGAPLEFPAIFPVAYAYPYFAFTDVRQALEMSVILANIETLELTTVSQAIDGGVNWYTCCHFTEDAASFRYVGTTIGEDRQSTYQVIDRDLDSGQDRVMYQEVYPSSTVFTGNSDGSQWISFKTVPGEVFATRIAIDGSTETLFQGSTEDRQFERHAFFGDYRLVIQPTCQSDCTIKVYSPESDDARIYPLPAGIFPVVRRVWRLPDNKLLAQIDSDVMILTPDMDPITLTEMKPNSVFLDQLSLDGRAVVLVDDSGATPRFDLYDTYTQQSVLTIDDARFVQAATFDGGFALLDLQHRIWVHQPQTETLVELAGDLIGDVLSDGRILYAVIEKDPERRELFVFDPATGDSTFLFASFFPVSARSLDLMLNGASIP
jgi:hypothetical protein